MMDNESLRKELREVSDKYHFLKGWTGSLVSGDLNACGELIISREAVESTRNLVGAYDE